MKIAIIIVLCIALLIVSLALYQTNKRLKFWRRNAIQNGRSRIRRNEGHDAEIGKINRKAAHKIAEQNATIEELEGEIRRLRNINRNLLGQMDRRSQ